MRIVRKAEGIELIFHKPISNKTIPACENLSKVKIDNGKRGIILLSIIPFLPISASDFIIKIVAIILVIPSYLIFIRSLYAKTI